MAQMHEVGRFTTPPETQHLEALAREAYAEIPEELRQALGDVVIRVLDFPDDETLEEMDCESPFDLLGLYRGVDVLRKSTYDTPDDLDMIYLYRRSSEEHTSELQSLMRISYAVFCLTNKTQHDTEKQ